MALLGLLLIYVTFAEPPALGWQAFLLVVGTASLWCADAMRRATSSVVILTESEMRDGDGTLIARVDDIEALDRGFFAFKPSNGFIMTLNSKAKNSWRPGRWWRVGRRVGVGGMTPAHQSKNMSEIIAIIMARREAE